MLDSLTQQLHFKLHDSFSTFTLSHSTSALSFSFLIVDSCSSSSSFLSSIPSCMILYFLSSIICSLLSCENSDKSEDKLLGDDISFFFRVGTTFVVLLNQGLSTSIGLLLSTSFGVLSSASEISKLLNEDMLDNCLLLGLSLITFVLHCYPDTLCTSHTSSSLIRPVFCGPKLLLQAVDFEVYIPPCSINGNSLIFADLTCFIHSINCNCPL